MSEFRLPALGADMEAGTLIEWKIKPGDTVKRGDIVAVVETDKGANEIEIFTDGTVEALLVETGKRVPVGTPIARLLEKGKTAPAPTPSAEELATPAPTPVPEAKAPKPTQVPPAPRGPPAPPGVRIVPAAKKRAAELGVDLATVKGTGEGGAITRADVEFTARHGAKPPAGTPAKPAATPPDRQAAMRRAIAAAMSRANREIPHYYLFDTVDVTDSLVWLAGLNAQKALAERMLPAVLVLQAVARAAKEFPDMNGFWVDDAAKPSEKVHLGVAISFREGGIVTPAIHDADAKSLEQLMADLRDLITRVRAHSMRSSEIADATLTVTNLGDLGVEGVLGVIYPPQVALVGAGAILERPWVVGGKVEPRKLLRLSLAADHRASDGMRGAQFLADVKRRLQSFGAK